MLTVCCCLIIPLLIFVRISKTNKDNCEAENYFMLLPMKNCFPRSSVFFFFFSFHILDFLTKCIVNFVAMFSVLEIVRHCTPPSSVSCICRVLYAQNCSQEQGTGFASPQVCHTAFVCEIMHTYSGL